MDRFAVVTDDNNVENVIVADRSFDPGEGKQLIDVGNRRVSPGDTYDPDTEEFIRDEPDTTPDSPSQFEMLEGRVDELETRVAELESVVQ